MTAGSSCLSTSTALTLHCTRCQHGLGMTVWCMTLSQHPQPMYRSTLCAAPMPAAMLELLPSPARLPDCPPTREVHWLGSTSPDAAQTGALMSTHLQPRGRLSSACLAARQSARGGGGRQGCRMGRWHAALPVRATARAPGRATWQDRSARVHRAGHAQSRAGPPGEGLPGPRAHRPRSWCGCRTRSARRRPGSAAGRGAAAPRRSCRTPAAAAVAAAACKEQRRQWAGPCQRAGGEAQEQL